MLYHTVDPNILEVPGLFQGNRLITGTPRGAASRQLFNLDEHVNLGTGNPTSINVYVVNELYEPLQDSTPAGTTLRRETQWGVTILLADIGSVGTLAHEVMHAVGQPHISWKNLSGGFNNMMYVTGTGMTFEFSPNYPPKWNLMWPYTDRYYDLLTDHQGIYSRRNARIWNKAFLSVD